MTVTRIRQDQVATVGSAIDDSLTPADHDGSAIDLQDTFNYVCSQIADILGEPQWESAPALSISAMSAKTWLEDKLALRDRLHLHDVTVPSSQNYVVLSQSGGETPTRPIAKGSTTEGAVSAELPGDVGSHSLVEVAGNSALNPKNLCLVFDASNGDPIESAGRQVYALLQCENGATDGGSWNDTDNQGQLSFVRPNSTYDDLEACPVADIENEIINYVYADREDLAAWSEQDFRQSAVLVDLAAPGVTQSLDIAYNGGSVVDVDDTDVEWRLTDLKTFAVTDDDGTDKILLVQALAAGDEVEINALLDMNGNVDGGSFKATFNSTEIGGAVGRVASVGAQDLLLYSTQDVKYTTVRETGFPLDDASAGPVSALTGGPHASVAAAIAHAMTIGGVDLTIGVTVLTSNYNQDQNIPGGAGGLDILAPHSIDMNTPSGVDTLIFLNGRLLYGGNGSTNNDVYAGDTPANGDIKIDFPRGVKSGDVFIAVQLVQ